MERTGEASTVFPIIFSFIEVVEAEGFKASVNCRGRAIAVFEDGEWWIHGVEPGGLCESGKTIKDAGDNFKIGFTEFLQDAAFGIDSFEKFAREVKDTFRQKDKVDERRWDRAVEAIRTTDKEDPECFAKAPRLPADSDLYVDVLQLDQTVTTEETPSRGVIAYARAA